MGPAPEMFCIFVLPRLDFLQFQYDCRSFSDKGGLLLGGGGDKMPQWGGTQGLGGGGFALQYICQKRPCNHPDDTGICALLHIDHASH